MADSLHELRAELTGIDRQILQLAARRRELAEQIGRQKRSVGRPTRDFAREYEVFQGARRQAAELGLSPDLADRLLTALIDSSLTVQEQDRLRLSGSGRGQSALVIGGSGKMGAWFARFLASQGFAVHIADPAGSLGDLPHSTDWSTLPLDDDLIVVAAPIGASAVILAQLAQRSPPGIVFDIGSMKSPLRSGIEALRSAGVRVTSVHPMFGPDVQLLSGRHVVFVDCGVSEATAAARALFDATMASQVEMDLDDHDRAMAWVLGLSHAVNIAFSAALHTSGEHAPRLAELSSTTYAAQVEVSRRVAAENPHLYFEIQADNDFGIDALKALEQSVIHIRSAIESRNESAFVELMQRGAAFFGS